MRTTHIGERVSENIYFDLTRVFNAEGAIAILASGQATVYYRIAIMSKDGDWILRETCAACERVLHILEARGARYRPGAPLDVDWLANGWSSHFEFEDANRHRIRCDFFTRPPRVSPALVNEAFAAADRAAPSSARLDVIGLEPLIRMKQTQRAKDYAVIAELARRLPPERELELSTDPDRLLLLGSTCSAASSRPAVQAARGSGKRLDVVLALAREANAMQVRDQRRVSAYSRAAHEYVRQFVRARVSELPLREGHERVLALANRLLPRRVDSPDRGGEDGWPE